MLKTLKDIDLIDLNLAREQLRAEAVKWVKNAKRINGDDFKTPFVAFFNLTEEDLI